MKTSIALAVLFVAVLLGGYVLYARPVPAPSSVPAAPVPAATSTPAARTYTAADVAAHGTAQSCWSSINGGVYDLTAWISEHPGGEGAILSICGKDGTNAFNGQHGRDPRAEAALATFKIGVLAP